MKTTTGSKTMGFAEVSTMLWRERDALQLLLFKLVSEQLIVSSGRTRWLAQANEEIEFALEQLRGTEVLRAAEADVLAEQLAIPSPATLAQLAAAAEEPWGTLFDEHRRALLELMGEIEQVTAENRRLLTAGARAVRETLLSVTETVRTYNSRGDASAGVSGPFFMDEQA